MNPVPRTWNVLDALFMEGGPTFDQSIDVFNEFLSKMSEEKYLFPQTGKNGGLVENPSQTSDSLTVLKGDLIMSNGSDQAKIYVHSFIFLEKT